MAEKSLFEQLCNEVRSGGFSVLSDRAQAEIIGYINRAMEDGYKRGYDSGVKSTKLVTIPVTAPASFDL